MHFDRILAALAGTPWAIDPAKGREIAAIVNRRISGSAPTPAEVEAYRSFAAARAERPRPRGADVALVPLYGVMTQRAEWFNEVSGLVSTEDVGRQIDAAAASPAVKTIVIDIDSPGGSVFGTAELAAKVAAAAEAKKVIAVANSMAASGAYWVASQASELVVTPSGMVGSIGVCLMHVDRSEEVKQAGQSVTFVAEGERKLVGNEFGPLGEQGLAEFQEIVSGYYAKFVKDVAVGREVSAAAVRSGFGRGGMVLAEAAVKEGMADKVASLDDVLARFGVTAADVVPPATRPDRPLWAIRNRRMGMR